MPIISGGGGGGGSQPYLVQKTQISSAQILALRTTPIEIVPAPGAGKFAIPLTIVCSFHAGLNGYNFGGHDMAADPAPDSPQGSNSFLILAGSVQSAMGTSDSVFALGGEPLTYSTGNFYDPLTTIENQPWNLYVNDANPTAGDGTLTVSVPYIVFDVT